MSEPCWEVRDSPIHGVGLFARREIPRESRFLEYLGERISKRESRRRGLQRMERARLEGSAAVTIFELDRRWDIDGEIPGNPARYANHSCFPNCWMVKVDDRLWLQAVRTIAAGGEITFDYGFDLADFLDHPCRCGQPGCPGYIVREDLRPRLTRLLAKARRNRLAPGSSPVSP